MSFTYRGLEAQYKRHVVTAEEVEQQLRRMQQQAPRYSVVEDRATQLGDEVVLDYAGFCDGEQFAGGTAENQTLVLGSGTFIPGFEEQLVDKAVGEKVIVKVTFPEQYHADALAGKDAEFHCTIHQIRIKSQYELDDTFAKEIGGCDTLEQMREKLAVSMQAYTDERGEMDLQDMLLRQAAETLECAPSEEQIQAEVENQMQNLAAQLAQQGLSIEVYCQFLNTDEQKLREQCRANAENAVRVQATVDQIAELEQMEATKEEIDEAVAVVARQNNMTVEQLKPYYNEEFEQAIIKSVLAGKVMALIRQEAIITEAE